MIAIIPIAGIGEVGPGTDLVTLLLEAFRTNGLRIEHGDILVVTQKILSKSEGRFKSLSGIEPGEEANRLAEITGKDPRFVELVLSESSEVVRAAPNVLITRHRLGFVMANAGIDRSNIGPERNDEVLLLPADPDGSARMLHQGLASDGRVAPAIIISDSFGRPWRYGVVSVAIGAAGIAALVDQRGDLDRDGRTLEVTQTALGDILATAASLVSGEGAESVPAALIRGYKSFSPPRPASASVRPSNEDLFR